MNKKAGVMDIVFILVFLFILGISTFTAYMIYNKYQERTAELETFNNSLTERIDDSAYATLTAFDYLFIFIFVGLIIMAIVSTFTIQTHPVFFFVSIMLLIITIILAAPISNIFEEVANETAFSNASNAYTVIPYFMGRLPFFMLMVGAILFIALYAKYRMEQY